MQGLLHPILGTSAGVSEATRSASAGSGLFARKPREALIEETKAQGAQLSRAVGLLDLTALGIGAIIGTGIFVIIGEAIGLAGPAIILAFVMAGVTCVFSALSYAELASTMPVAGSAYSYSYATLGEFAAWIIGWDLILEYGLSVAAVAVGWGGYVQALLDSLFGIQLSNSIAAPPGEGGDFNLPAIVLVLSITAVLCLRHPRERPHQLDHGRDQDHDPAHLHRPRPDGVLRRQPHAVLP